ncbi:MAG: SMP-30/gluconolactonase/LRE family protein [Bacteroidales bacterium]|jgi:gluconolactonase|nr:SMP-30/gluconolactonase/LRE family protein [Bacteroidales bacterium]
MKKLNLSLLLSVAIISVYAQPVLIAPGAEIVRAGTGYGFTEGPAVDKDGKIYFSDQINDRIYIWEEGKECSLWLEGTYRANGMMFDKRGRLVACTELKNELGYFDKNKKYHVIAGGYNGKLLNGPNDLWITPNGYYFTDPYWQRDFWPKDRVEEQDVKGVYFVNKKGEIKRVIDDFRLPNGIFGSLDGKILFVADMMGRKTWKYTIQPNGDLTDKTPFIESGSDGMTVDNLGNFYITARGRIQVYSPEGEFIQDINVPESPTNVTFGGKNRDILFITAWTSVYTLKMNVKGIL